MFVRINASNGVPVYDQIARQVKYAVADGVLAAGDLIPSVRELAKELAVNPNTVARAYRELQGQEVVEAVPGTGLAVRTGAKRACTTERRNLLQQRVRSVLEETQQAGLEWEAIQKLVEAELQRLNKQHDN